MTERLKRILVLLPSDLKILVLDSGTLYEGCSISLDDYDPGNCSTAKKHLIRSTGRRVFKNESDAATKLKRYYAVLAEGENKRFWSVGVLILCISGNDDHI